VIERDDVVVYVPGIPRPAGSKRVFLVGKTGDPKRPVLTDASGGPGRDWRVAVQHAIVAVHPGPPLTGPLELVLYFTVLRPQGHTGRHGLRERAPAVPATRPDLTKLIRAVEDAATGLLWVDDAQIVSQMALKRFGPRPGLMLCCRPFTTQAIAWRDPDADSAR
jgi:crossover junction endodeoxyribonuclease RusA